MPLVQLTYYCVLILAASIAGGMIPVWFRLTHRWMQFAVSFVAGVMLGIGVLHMLPHALVDAAAATAARSEGASTLVGDANLPMDAVSQTMLWLLAGMLVMFFIERFFCFHHHDVPSEHGAGSGEQGESSRAVDQKSGSAEDPFSRDAERSEASNIEHPTSNIEHPAPSAHHHDLSWSGAALGLTLHSVINGVALAAAAQHGNHGAWLAGFGTFLVIFLHKPLDAMTIGMLMARGGWSLKWRHTVNALFSLAIPAGVLLFYFGLMPEAADPSSGAGRLVVAYALAFSAGTFLCISLSDLLPELQFHQHDRVKLSVALLLGLGVSYVAGRLEATTHSDHAHPVSSENPVGSLPQANENSTIGTSGTCYLPFVIVANGVSVECPPSSARC